MPFSDIFSLPVFDAAEHIMKSPRMLTFISSVLFPFISAVAVFMCLHAAGGRRKLLCFFLGMPLYIIPTAFLLTDIGGTAQAVVGTGALPAVPDIIGFIAASALGIAYLGITALICSEGVTKTPGRSILFASTVLCFSGMMVICYYALLQLTDSAFESTLEGVFPSLASLPFMSSFRDLPLSYVCVLLISLFLILFFISFLFDKNRDELRAEDIEKLHRIEKESARIEKEGVCAVCRYALLPESGRGNVRCTKKGSMPPDGRCPRFEYDPLKRIPEKKEPVSEKENPDEETV